ncbi:inverted formin-2-like [Stegostoma tigrinum]|uniref:inverted formin-2-like n=1 Tax=Stegostoma tigrinum TaxID=3053191 RepID=UPI002870096B|nr:inverted formin-2-like [Stegostoma tigrinum]
MSAIGATHMQEDPKVCIHLLQDPTLRNYYLLKKYLTNCSDMWMVEFLELSGLNLMLKALDKLSSRGMPKIDDALLQLTCVSCVKAVMNSPNGIEHLVNDENQIRKLLQALNTSVILVKKQVFDLLAALCMYSPEGHDQVLYALQHYKNAQRYQYGLNVIVSELQTDNVPYLVSLLSVINALILGTENLQKRARLRNQFIGLHLLDALPNLRKKDDVDVLIQCSKFEEARAEDDEDLTGIYDMNCHQDVFAALFNKVRTSPASIQLLSILQGLLQLEPSNKSGEENSLWLLGRNNSITPDYARIEQLFCFSFSQTKKKDQALFKKESKEVTFLDSKKNLNLNIFLKQFKCSNEELVGMVQKSRKSEFDAEVLKQFKKLLPDEHERENIITYKEEKEKLANGDHFYLCLLKVPCYELRIDCLLPCEDIAILQNVHQPNAKLIKKACENLLTSPRLTQFCQLILKIGNFLNYGSAIGNANGFKINSLVKLKETRANEPQITLLHYAVQEIEESYPDLLNLPDDLQSRSEAASIKTESIQSEVSSLSQHLNKISDDIESSIDDIKLQFRNPIQISKYPMQGLTVSEELKDLLKAIECKRKELAQYFCENENKFSLDELFSTFKKFRELFLQAIKDNNEQKHKTSKMKKREKQLAVQVANEPNEHNSKFGVSRISFVSPNIQQQVTYHTSVEIYRAGGGGSGREYLDGYRGWDLSARRSWHCLPWAQSAHDPGARPQSVFCMVISQSGYLSDYSLGNGQKSVVSHHMQPAEPSLVRELQTVVSDPRSHYLNAACQSKSEIWGEYNPGVHCDAALDGKVANGWGFLAVTTTMAATGA